jgi:hypothetical protein
MHCKLKATYFLFMLLLSVGAYSQSKKELEEEAVYYFNNKDYQKAYDLYDKLYTKNPKIFDYKFRLAFCSLNYPDKKARAIELFEDIKRVEKPKDVDYYLGKAYHLNYRFDDAIKALSDYLATKAEKVRDNEKAVVDDAKLTLEYCKNGKELVDKKIKADITNIGPPINTMDAEYVPVITADESMMIFTYSGPKSVGGKIDDDFKQNDIEGYYHEDIYMSIRKPDSTWGEPVGLSSINTKGNDAPIAISPDGNTLFTYNSTNADGGDIYQANLVGQSWTTPERLNKNINTEYWEGSCSLSGDGRYLYFASEKPGGLGGRDIWVSEKINGDWGPAINLGPSINTPQDEDAPFIHPDGITLFLSSKGHGSIGGYDIMYTIKKENEWLTPKNMGIPLNTTEDDRYYVINATGDKGFFSSNRGGAGGKGKQDIYMVQPGVLGEKPIIALLKGTVYGDDKPIESKIEVFRLVHDEHLSKEELEALGKESIGTTGKLMFGPYQSNSETGKYLFALSPGSTYKVVVSAKGYDPIQEDVDMETLNKFVEVKKDFYLYSPGKAPETPTAVTTGTATNTTATSNSVAATTGTAATTNTVAATTGTSSTTKTGKNPKTGKTTSSKTGTTSVATTTETPVSTGTETAVTTTDPTSNPCSGGPKPDFSPLKGKSLNDPEVYKQLLALGGDHCASGMIFKVQIAAYRHPQNYKYDHLIQYGKPDIKDYPDGITRFTQLEFKTIREAEVQRQKAIAKGQKDAWIVGFIDGKRYTLEELISLDFLGKSIN